MSDQQNVISTENISMLQNLYEKYHSILKTQCQTPDEMIPPMELFIAEQTQTERVCDIRDLLTETDKKNFLIRSFWFLLGVAPEDQMLRSAENYPSTIRNYQRDLIFSILHSQQFRQNDVKAIHNPWEGKATVKQELGVIARSVYRKLPTDLQNRIRQLRARRQQGKMTG